MTTVPFVFTCFNPGDHGTLDDLLRVCNPRWTDVTALCEMYNRKNQRMLDRLLDSYGGRLSVVEFPDVEGARSNPLIYDTETLKLLAPQCYKVLEAGTRAGKHNMQKNLVGGRFRFLPAPCQMDLFGKHSIQTQGPAERRRAAIRMSRNEVGVLDDRVVTAMLGGDWNAIPGSPSLRPYRGEFASTQAADPKDTFKNRNIDGVVWHGPLRDTPVWPVRFIENTLIRGTRSDHLGIRAHFQIRVKPW
jgi:hypothetical protein